MTVTDMNAYRGGRRRIGSILVTVGLVMAGCASSGDVEQVRQERAQAKAKMSAELQQERTLAQSMEQESEARKAEADKLAKALGGKQSQAGPKLQLAATGISLTAALQDQKCQVKYRTGPSSDAWGLYIAPNTPCSNVTVSAADATFTAQAPLRPVVIEHGGTLTLLDQTMTLYASSFLIWRGGIMQAGTATNPIQNQITIVMAGNSSPSPAPLASGGSPIVITTNNTPNARDLTVMDGGILRLYGGKGLSTPSFNVHNSPPSPSEFAHAFFNTVSGTKSWTYLAAPAGPAKYNDAENVSAPVPATNPATTLILATTVDWQQNDWISVATTSFSSHQTEIVQICGISSVANPDPLASTLGLPANVSQITLCQNLKHYHYGGLTPTPGFFPVGTKQVVAKGGNAIDVGRQAKSFYDGPERNYGIDERAEVALLSRNIKLTSVAGQTSDANNFIGGHVVAMVSSPTVAMPTLHLVGVEVEKFGQPLVGRYPVHLHMLPNGGNVLVQDVSVHHSYNKCYVPHQTPNAKFYNNVCVRTVGQGMYLEDGTNITGNQFMRNHIAGVMAANTTYSYPRQNGSTYWDGDHLQSAQPSNTWYTINGIPDTSYSNANVANGGAKPFTTGPDLFVPGGFWITNLGNTFVNNSVAGCQAQGRGYWLTPQDPNQIYAYPEFTGNRTHGCYHGIDTQPDGVNTLDPKPTMNGTSNDHAPLLLLNDNTVTRSRARGFWGRGIFITLHNNRFATNPFGFTLLGGGGPDGNIPGFWGMAYDNVVAGMTRNNVERYAGGCYFRVTNAQSTSGPPNYTPVTSGGAVYTVITSPTVPPSGTTVQISGVQGTISANGTWTVTKINDSQFALPPPFNYGTYSGGGMWTFPPPNAPQLQTECTDVVLYDQNVSTFGKFPSTTMNVQGYSYYDGPARIEHNRFVNFRFDPTGIYPNDPAARLLTQTDIAIIASQGMQGQLTNPTTVVPAPNAASAATYQGYAGDPATGWQQANAQSVPPTQYIRDSIWENVDFKHQIYTEAVNMGAFSDGDKTTVILDKDSQLTGFRVVDGNGQSHHDIVPVSLNSVDYYATDYTVDEPHSRGSNDFRSTSLMSPHKYSTLSIESANPAGNRVEIKRDMPAYGDSVYPSLFLYGRGGYYLYEPFVMDRMGYTVYAKTSGSQEHGAQTPAAFEHRLLFSYTDPAVKKVGDYFINRIGVYQVVTDPTKIQVYRIRRQWGQQYTSTWPPNYVPPIGNSCDNAFLSGGNWQDCLNRANNKLPYNVAPYTNLGYPYGMTLSPAKDWNSFEKSYKDLLAGTITVANFITNQTYYYDSTNSLLYFYMIEDAPVQRGYAPYGTCNAAKYSNYVEQIQGIKSFSDPNSVQAALDASCLVSGGTPQQNDLFSCNEIGCASYLVDFSKASVNSQPPQPPSTPPHPIARTDYSAWNQYHFVYATPSQQPNGLPVVANPAVGNTPPPQDGAALIGLTMPSDGSPPPQGDRVTYNFQSQSGLVSNVTEDFRYRCVTTPPWAPVNARGAYPPTGGFTYPLSPSVCMTAAQGTAVMEAGVVLQVVVTNPGSGYSSPPTVTITPPAGGMQAQGVATIANGSVTGVTMTNQGSGYNFGPQVTFSPPVP